jgi:hypothetical protein
LKAVYSKGSLRTSTKGFELILKNNLAPATVISLLSLKVDGRECSREDIFVVRGESRIAVNSIDADHPLVFPLYTLVTMYVQDEPLTPGRHRIVISLATKEVGMVDIPIVDKIK